MTQHNVRFGWRVALFGCIVLLGASCGGGDTTSTTRQAPQPRVDQTPDQEARPVNRVTVVTGVDGPRRTMEDLPFDHSWDLTLPAPVHMAWMDDAQPGLLFVQVATGQIHGIDVYSGMTRWVTQALPVLLRKEQPPFVARDHVRTDGGGEEVDDRLYVISGDRLMVFDCAYGQLIWSFHLGQGGQWGFQPSSGPAVAGSGRNARLFIGDWEGRVRVISFDDRRSRAYVRWQWNLLDVPTAQPMPHDNAVFVGDRGGKMRSFALDRDLRWEYDAQAPILQPPYVRGRSLYFGDDDNVFHVLDRRTGRRLGAQYLPSSVNGRPFSFSSEPQRLYVWTGDGAEPAGLRGFHTADDNVDFTDVERHHLEVERIAQDWFLPGIDRVVASSPGQIYATRRNSLVVLGIGRTTGEINWHWDLRELEQSGDPIVDLISYTDASDEIRTVITTSARGRLVAYRLFGHMR